MIEKIANNRFNTEALNPNPSHLVKEKLDFFRGLFGKVQDLPDEAFEMLKKDIATFFNLKPVHQAKAAPEMLIRISNNKKVLEKENSPLGLLKNINQLLAPPVELCRFGRCNMRNQQVLYCAMDEASAYWEVKPRKGDVITLSYFKIKEDAKVNCSVITNKAQQRVGENDLIQTYYYLDDFFIDAFSLPVAPDRPRDYVFSAMLSSEQLFYPITSPDNIEAIIYPSVQKKLLGHNLAIRNDLMLDRYDLIAVETRFILDEYENIDANSFEVTTDDLMGSMASYSFDFINGKVLYNDEADRMFEMFREWQTSGGKQIRYDTPKKIRRIPFNFSKGSTSSLPTNKSDGESFNIGRIDIQMDK